MRIPVIRGLIDRRILVNYRVDPDMLKKLLPQPFRPKIIKDVGIAGICLIRLKDIRPSGFPGGVGISSENAAHRIAVEWDEQGKLRNRVVAFTSATPREGVSHVVDILAKELAAQTQNRVLRVDAPFRLYRMKPVA